MDYSEYFDWATREMDTDFSAAAIKRRFELNSQQILSQVRQHPFVLNLPEVLSEASAEYESEHIRLLSNSALRREGPEWKTKSYDSTVNKTFRLNVLQNDRFPESPDGGWCDDSSMYQRIDDLVRTTVVAKYLSGAELIAKHLMAAANIAAVPCRFSRRDSEHGYYGFHLHFSFPVTLTAVDFVPYETLLDVELQITTQLQDALYDLTHRFYELRRIGSVPSDEAWKWKTTQPRFKASYAGHALHLIEGMFEELLENERVHDREA